MAITVTNHKPCELKPYYNSSLKDDLDVPDIIKQIIVDPINNSALVPTAGVTITKSNGSAVTDDEIISCAADCCGETWQTASEEFMRQLMSQTLLKYNPQTTLSFREIFAVQSAADVGLSTLPDPGASVIYQSSEVIQASAQFIAGTIDYNQLFATFAYYSRLEIFGIYFINEVEFQNFLQYMDTQVNLIQSSLTPECLTMVNDFKKLKLDGLTESIHIRNDDTENIEPFSFARLITNLFVAYAQNSGLCDLMPMNFSELVVPKNIVMFNIEKFAHATPNQIWQEFKDIKDGIGIASNINMISNKKLMQLTVMPRTLRKTASQNVLAAQNKNSMAARAARTVYRKRLPTSNEYLHLLSKILEKMKTNRMTMNVYKYQKPSFQKPNRRDPDDWNKQGRITSTKYFPDIHLYLDTSGSISEEDYAAAVKMCIHLAKKLNINLYVNSFSHIMSQTTMLNCKDKSLKEIFGKFLKIPKVQGGTNFVQIWDFINRSPKRREEMSIIISDMEFNAPARFITHPKNLYYVPINIYGASSLAGLHRACDSFVDSCRHNDPNIRRRILL